MDGSSKHPKQVLKAKFCSPFQRSDPSKKAAAGKGLGLAASDQQQNDEQAPMNQCATSARPTALRPHQNTSSDAIAGAHQNTSTTTGSKSKPFKAPAKVQQPALGKENKKDGASLGSKPTAARKEESGATRASYYTCLYSARSSKKKKPSLQDGVLQVLDTKCCLYGHDGKVVGRTTAKACTDMPEGATLEIGSWELEIFGRLPASSYLDGSCFIGVSGSSASEVKDNEGPNFVPKPAKPFKKGLHWKTDAQKSSQAQIAVCRYTLDEASTVLDKHESGGRTCTIVVDPFLASKLRPHQKEGVRFMYRCVMGLQTATSSGCLLADEMGLGKTLQTLTLIWTLLKQGPLGKPAIRRAIVVCPSSLVENWASEVKKWLGLERLRALAIHAGTAAADAKSKFDDFTNGNVWPLLITSYELARKYSAKIAEAKCELLICDEAHRLKNSAGNKTIEALQSLKCPRRVLLSGTPLQNNLSEFFAMISFIAPELLGTLPTFKRLYADPIERSRDRTATDDEKLLGEERSAELQKRTQLFVLRRTSEVNAKYLPPRTEYVVFCNLQPLQLELYQTLLQSKVVSSLLMAGTATTAHSVLATIGLLRKLCNHPHLLHPERTRGSIEDQEMAKMDGPMNASVPPEAITLLNERPCDAAASSELSGKFAALMAILQAVADHNALSGDKDKVVVVSEWTATLDVIQDECTRRSWDCLRLDGATAVADRQGMVNRFNAGHCNETIFLLSKKAGGCGLNLIGAHRLVLFDSDWNPANDKQAMARIWRDGQAKPVVIYRLLSRGTIEEKIYQRQIAKDEVAAEVTGGQGMKKSSNNQRHFSKEELKELFTLRTDTACDTRDLVESSSSGENGSWQDASSDVTDAPLRAAIEAGHTSFVRHQVDESDLAVKEEEGPSEAAEVKQAVSQDARSDRSPERKSTSLRLPARATESGNGRPQKRRKKVVLSDSEQEDCADEKIFKELDEEDE